jgi:pectate lyase
MERLIASASLILVSTMLSPIASATCDITQTKCWVNGGNCNIKFKNRTGDTGGSDGSSNLNQSSSAQTVTVKARKANKDKAGNKLTIIAGTSDTMNIEKKAKKKFVDIQLSPSVSGINSTVMSCEDVQAVLDGNGTCKVFHGYVSNSSTKVERYLGYQCDGGNVGGPKDASTR